MLAVIIESYGDQTITYEIEKIGPIIEGDRYGGLSVKLIGRLENIRQPFSIDFATGDPMTPYAIHYTFEYRETQWDTDEIINLLDLIKSSRIMETRWIQFSKSHPFAGNINHSDVIDEICQLVLMMKTKMKAN